MGQVDQNTKWENIQIVLDGKVIKGIEPITYHQQKRIPRKLKKKFKKGYLKGSITLEKW